MGIGKRLGADRLRQLQHHRKHQIVDEFLVRRLVGELDVVLGYGKAAGHRQAADTSRLSTHNARIAEMDKQVAVLFKKQFELLNELSSTFYETHGIKKDKEAIYKHVRENIESFMKNKREIEHLENIVDNYRGGIIGKLREEFPQFGEHDIRFIVFICAGFSPKAISIFMEESVGNIYTKKSRIKSIISRSDSTHKELFIEALS
jgi:hypothetical protein